MKQSRYGESEQSERPVRLDKTEGFVVIEGRAYPARELVEALAQSGYAELRAIGDSLVLGRKRITPVFKSRQERAMASLCHGSLAFCCPLSKRCADRDRALEVLGLTHDDYERTKGESHGRFIDIAKGLEPSASVWDQVGVRERTVTRPAVDRGYGSEDYRRDFDELDRALKSGNEPGHWSGPRRGSEDREHDMDRADREVRLSGDLLHQLKSTTEDIGSSAGCKMTSEEVVGGLGALFSQGELTPFRDDTSSDDGRPSFCFACGRTIERGLQVCPHCGSTQ